MPKQKTTKTEAVEAAPAAYAGADAMPSMTFLLDWNAEIMRFYMSRFQKIGMLPWRLQSCRTPDEFNDLQADFQRQLTEDYKKEAARLSRLTGASVHSAETDADADYAATLLKAQEDAAAIIEEAKEQAESIVEEARKRAKEFAETSEAASKKSA